MNLIITCARHFEEETSEEIRRVLMELGDQEPKVMITSMPGILTAITGLNPINIIEKIREKIIDEPWSVRYCFRIIPIQNSCQTNLIEIVDKIQNMIGILKPDESYRITIEKRNTKISSNEIISEIAKNIPNKVSLDNPDWIILIEIIGDETGVSVLRNNMILSVEKVKRSLSE
ncbi:MAG TPA: THUMP domain-containing protein [Nitrosopumilaceae archaeon]